MIKPDFSRVFIKYILMIGLQCVLYDVVPGQRLQWPFDGVYFVQNIIVLSWIIYIILIMILRGVRAKTKSELKDTLLEEARDIPWNLCYIVVEFAGYYIQKWIFTERSEIGILIASIVVCAIFEIVEKNTPKGTQGKS